MADNSGWPWPGVLSIGAPNFANALPPAFWNDMNAGKAALSGLFSGGASANVQDPSSGGGQPPLPANALPSAWGNPTGEDYRKWLDMQLRNSGAPAQPPAPAPAPAPVQPSGVQPGLSAPNYSNPFLAAGAGPGAGLNAGTPIPNASPASAATAPPIPPKRPKTPASPNLGRYPPPPGQRFIPIQWQAASGGPSSGALAPSPGSRAPIYTALNLFGRG